MAVLVFRGDRWRWGRGGWGGFIPHADPDQGLWHVGATAGRVPGVTSRCARSFPGRYRISAAMTARSAQSSRGPGLARRPRAGAPAAPRSWTLTSGRAGPASRRAGRRPDRAGGGTRLTIMPHGRTPPIAAGHRNRPNFGTRQGHVRSGRCLPAYLLVVALSSVDVPVAMTAPHADPTRARRELSGRGRGCWAPGCLTARATGWPRR
jgi:hypothetical protein